MLSAHCGACHATFDGLHLGAGMLGFMEHCAVPALCSNCRVIADLDYLAPNPRCPSCNGEVRFYDPELGGEPQGWLSWNIPNGQTVTLSEDGSLCPRCGAHALSFIEVGAFD
jgi:DNA-directed RNA polymerase subunit RPC12/RpoP